MQYKEKIERKNVVQSVIIRNLPYKSQVNVYEEPELETILILVYILVYIASYFN